jgi:hypothetical protein
MAGKYGEIERERRMILIESFFINGEPVGKICEDIHKGVVTFEPKTGNKHLACRKWKSVVCCQRAILKFYRSESPR